PLFSISPFFVFHVRQPPLSKYRDGQWEAKEYAALRDQKRSDGVAPAPATRAHNRVIVLQVCKKRERPCIALLHIAKEQEPSKSSAQEDERGRNQPCNPFAR